MDDEWRPIETAPRDRSVLLWCPADQRQRVGEWSKSVDTGDEAWRFATFWLDETFHVLLCNPTHWRPLPTPPDLPAEKVT